MNRGLSWAAAAAAIAASFLLFGLAFPPVGWKPLAWVALVPLLLVIRTGSRGRAALLTATWGVFAAYVTGDWMPEAVAVYFLQPAATGYLFFLGIALSMVAPYYTAFALALRPCARATPATWMPLVTACVWVVAELGRGRLFTGSAFFIGNPWGLLGYSQMGFDHAVQIASLFGVYGISFALVAANAGIAEFALVLWRDPSARTTALKALAVGILPGVLILGFGAWELAAAEHSAEANRPAIPIAVAQGDVNLGRRWRSDFYGRNLDVYLDLTRQAGREARVVFWPESAFTFFLEDEPAYRRAIRSVLAAGDLELVAGGPRSVEAEGEDRERFYNTIFAISPQGEVEAKYDKKYLVPFSEYIPFAGLDLIRRRFEGARVFTHGGAPTLLPTRAGAAGVLVCNEAMLPEVAARRVAAGAHYLVNPSNDTWIPDLKFSDHLFDVVSLRAVEQRRYLVRASTSGPSAIVDPWGRVTVRTPTFERALLLGQIRPRTGLSVYAHLGDTFAFACLGVSVIGVGVGVRRGTA